MRGNGLTQKWNLFGGKTGYDRLQSPFNALDHLCSRM